ncbi:hypothetical protein [Nocardiopsis rhodophaea]|uniref:hypothetical protein n=1 Tax=Nocardiopsis rhodophaea TaxID=280238 RepID=UPI0031D5BD57
MLQPTLRDARTLGVIVSQLVLAALVSTYSTASSAPAPVVHSAHHQIATAPGTDTTGWD